MSYPSRVKIKLYFAAPITWFLQVSHSQPTIHPKTCDSELHFEQEIVSRCPSLFSWTLVILQLLTG